jgi:predicted MFS family arabinose efflux permease
MQRKTARVSRVLEDREFRALWLAEVLSVCGDQLARVAVLVLVYQRTSSAAWAGLTYALTYLPTLVGGLALAGLADRHRRRELIVVTDVCRAVLAGVMALPGLPLPLLAVALILLTTAGGPFKAAQLALMFDVLGEERYRAGSALRSSSTQLAQVLGFAVGGAVLTVISPYTALGINALTFLVAAVIVRACVAARGVPAGSSNRAGRGLRAAVRLIWGNRRTRGLLAMAWLVGLFVVPEGVAAPYAAQLGGTAAAVGLLMAADPLGSVLGAWLSGRAPGATMSRLMVPTAMVAGVALILCVGGPPLWISLVLWAVSGVATSSYLIQAQSEFVGAIPDESRGSAVGVASSGMQATQGLAIAGGGGVADLIGASGAVALAGAMGALLAVLVGISWLRARDH